MDKLRQIILENLDLKIIPLIGEASKTEAT
jgi:hypothetical protein